MKIGVVSTVSSHALCPRCRGDLVIEFSVGECRKCGYVEYFKVKETANDDDEVDDE